MTGECARLFSSIPLLEKRGCRCFFAMSNRELQKLLIHTNPDIVLSLNTRNRLFEMMTLLRRLPVNMFHMLPVEKGCWWLPVLRDGKDCLGICALRAGEFSEVFAEIVRSTRLARAEGVELTGSKNQYLEPTPIARLKIPDASRSFGISTDCTVSGGTTPMTKESVRPKPDVMPPSASSGCSMEFPIDSEQETKIGTIRTGPTAPLLRPPNTVPTCNSDARCP